MSFLPKNEWLNWAREWALTHYPQKGWLYRNEHVVGLHGGVLVQAGWGGEKNACLIVRLRFPRTANLENLRNALVADTALDALPGKGAGRAKMTIVRSAPSGLRLVSRPEFALEETALVWTRRPGLGGVKPQNVPAWVDALVGAVRRVTPGFDGHCEQCVTGSARQYVLVDDVPMMLCGSCQQRMRSEGEMAERAYDMTETQRFQGATFAAVGATLGAIAWATFAALTDRISGLAAIGIGALVAWAYRRGAGRLDGAGRLIGATFTLISVVLGQVLYYAWQVSRIKPGIGFRPDLGWKVYLVSWSRQPGLEAIALLFGLVGAWFAFRVLQRPRQHKVIREAGEDPHESQRRAA